MGPTALAWVAVVMFVQSVPVLLLGDMAGIDAHNARHLGAFGTALAIGFAYAAWKPHRAFGMLPFTAALVATTLISLLADVVGGTRTPVAELLHVSEVVGLTLLWVIAGSPGLGRVVTVRPSAPVEPRSAPVAVPTRPSRGSAGDPVRPIDGRRTAAQVVASQRIDRRPEVAGRPRQLGEHDGREPNAVGRQPGTGASVPQPRRREARREHRRDLPRCRGEFARRPRSSSSQCAPRG